MALVLTSIIEVTSDSFALLLSVRLTLNMPLLSHPATIRSE